MTSKCKRLFAWKPSILKGFTLWPTIVMLSFFLDIWVFVYNFADRQIIVAFIFTIIFPAVCLVWGMVSLVRKKPRSSVSFIFPVLLLVFICSPWGAPIRYRFFDLRHCVEFQIQKRFFFPEMNDPNKLPPYKEWPLNKARGTAEYAIIYDLKGSLDEREKKKNIIMEQGYGYLVTKVGNHFYMLTEYYKY